MRKRIYSSPTVEVVEMKTSKALLDTSANMQGYTYDEENGWKD